MTHAYVIAAEATALLMLWLALSVWQRDRRTPGALFFVLLCAAVMLWCLADVGLYRDLLTPAQRDRLAFLGIVTIPACWVGVAAHSAGLPLVRRVAWSPALLWVPGAALYLTLFAGPWADLFVSSGAEGGQGPLFDAWTAYAYAVLAFGTGIFVLGIWRWPGEQRVRRAVALVAGVGIPLVGNAVHVLGIHPFPIDPTPVLIGAAALPLRSAIFRAGFFDVVPLEQQDLLMRLPIGIVLADDQRGVLQINQRAQEILGLSRQLAQGRSLEALLAEAPPDLAFHAEELALGGSYRLTCLAISRRDAAAPRSSLHVA
ncbi:MAG: histidine kinase N-terminal 7TM domain-containing protein [Myxococcota bacterium]|nr:histidine kinase N-terminal 7TM domain-containing protein [Myxococcota bacterium]